MEHQSLRTLPFSAPPDLLPLFAPFFFQLFLDISCNVIYWLSYYSVFGVGEIAPAFLFQARCFSICQSKTTKIASFKINQLRNAIFVSPFV
jgi:hypothetical protein